MNTTTIKVSIALLFVLSILEVTYGVILAITEAPKDTPTCLDETLVVPYWFTVKGYILLVLTTFLYIYSWREFAMQYNIYMSTIIWMLIFGHFAWICFGCNVFWKCQFDVVLWLDILLNYCIFVFQIRILFEIHHLKNRIEDNDYDRDIDLEFL